MNATDLMDCYLVKRDAAGDLQASYSECLRTDLPEGNVLIQVQWSSLNYKDALAATGHVIVPADANDTGQQSQDGGRERLAKVTDFRIISIRCHQVLDEIIGADRNKIDGT